MNPRLHLVLPALALFAAPRAIEEEVVFRPEKGAKMTFNFESTVSMELVDSMQEVLVDGEDRSQDAPDIELTIDTTESYVISDEILEADGDRVAKLRRTFDTLDRERTQSIEGPAGSDSADMSESSALEEVSVVFEWDEDEEEYVVSFDEDSDEDDEELLEDLEFDLHFASLLPDGAVSRGDTWEPDVESLDLVMSPGGDLHFVGDDVDEETEDEVEDEIDDEMDDNVEGTVTCKLLEIREDDGRVAVIEITAESSTYGDGDQDMEAPMGSGTATRTIEAEYEVKGQLLWDLDAHRPIGLELSGDVTLTLIEDVEISGDMEIAVNSEQSFEGTVEISLEVE